MEAVFASKLKKKALAEGAIIVYTDEASFKQSPTLHATWAPINSQPLIDSTGERNTQKILGAVSCSGKPKFIYKHQEKYFNYETYIDFLEKTLLPQYYKKGHRVYLIQDNASYHKKKETYAWFKENRQFIEVFNLPPYFPELNATEKIWWYTRKDATHNKYFETKEYLCQSLFQTFHDIQKNPEKINKLMAPFF
jgi:transposase